MQATPIFRSHVFMFSYLRVRGLSSRSLLCMRTRQEHPDMQRWWRNLAWQVGVRRLHGRIVKPPKPNGAGVVAAFCTEIRQKLFKYHEGDRPYSSRSSRPVPRPPEPLLWVSAESFRPVLNIQSPATLAGGTCTGEQKFSRPVDTQYSLPTCLATSRALCTLQAPHSSLMHGLPHQLHGLVKVG